MRCKVQEGPRRPCGQRFRKGATVCRGSKASGFPSNKDGTDRFGCVESAALEEHSQLQLPLTLLTSALCHVCELRWNSKGLYFGPKRSIKYTSSHPSVTTGAERVREKPTVARFATMSMEQANDRIAIPVSTPLPSPECKRMMHGIRKDHI